MVAVHDRAFGRFTEVLTLDHSLEVLIRKPGALPGATALAQAKAAGAFTASHQRYWDSARNLLGDRAGTRALIDVLLAHRGLAPEVLRQALDRSIETGCIDPQLVLIDARRLARTDSTPAVPIGVLTRYDRPVPSLTAYDTLLTGS
jgi:hypothetical protein